MQSDLPPEPLPLAFDGLPLSPSSTAALSMAEGMRRARGKSRVHMEDLLLGLFRSKPEGPTRRLFEALELEEDELIRLLQDTLEVSLPPPSSVELDGLPTLSGHTKEAFSHAATFAEGDGDNRLRSRHLLAGFGAVTQCTVVKAIEELRPDFQDQLKRIVGPGEPESEEPFTFTLSDDEEPPTPKASQASQEALEDPQEQEELEEVEDTDKLQDVRVQRLANDLPTGPDRLGIESEVHAIAEAITLKALRPPLVVGVLGGWGTGKSFVLHLLEEHIARIRSEALAPGDPGADASEREEAGFPYVGHPYVLRFDAWTYAKSNLWASLMQTIFLGLDRQLGIEELLKNAKIDPLEDTELWRLMHSLNTSQLEELAKNPRFEEALQVLRQGEDSPQIGRLWQAIASLKQREEAALKATRKELGDARQKLRKKHLEIEGQVEAELEREAKWRALGPVKERVQELLGETLPQDESQEPPNLQQVASGVGAWRRTLQGWNFGATLTCLFALLSFLLTFAPERFGLPADSVDQIPTALSGLLATLLSYLESARSFRERLDQEIETYENQLETYRQQDAERRQALLEAKLQEERAQTGVEGSISELERQIQGLEARIEVQRRRVGPVAEHRSLVDFVRGRLEDGTYDPHLGLLHRVQADLADLTEALLPSPTESDAQKEQRETLFPRGEPRVILMIDDLDRCPPERVVEVLEAAQLLVKTRLFVVVVAMDVRYVTRCLEKLYEGVLSRDGKPSGLDYIEKIIQLPYRVPPIHPDFLPTFLGSQLEIDPSLTWPPLDSKEGDEVEAPKPTRGFSLADEVLDDKPEGTRGLPKAAPAPPGPEDDSAPSDTLEDTTPDDESGEAWLRGPLPTQVLKCSSGELEQLATACRLVDVSPRSARRLVNVFKLLKIIWYRRGLQQATDTGKPLNDGPSPAVRQAMLGLLAAAARYPEVLCELLPALEVALRGDSPPKGSLMSFLEEHCQELGLPQAASEGALKTLRPLLGETLTLEELDPLDMALVTSFSFVGESEALSAEEDAA